MRYILINIHNKKIGFILGQLGTDCPKDILPILVEICSDVTCPAIARHEVLSAF
jgi:hypothetical protein